MSVAWKNLWNKNRKFCQPPHFLALIPFCHYLVGSNNPWLWHHHPAGMSKTVLLAWPYLPFNSKCYY
jgi:hypothetical protein